MHVKMHVPSKFTFWNEGHDLERLWKICQSFLDRLKWVWGWGSRGQHTNFQPNRSKNGRNRNLSQQFQKVTWDGTPFLRTQTRICMVWQGMVCLHKSWCVNILWRLLSNTLNFLPRTIGFLTKNAPSFWQQTFLIRSFRCSLWVVIKVSYSWTSWIPGLRSEWYLGSLWNYARRFYLIDLVLLLKCWPLF